MCDPNLTVGRWSSKHCQGQFASSYYICLPKRFPYRQKGHVLLTGEPYPYTEPSVLEEAKRFYRFGYTYGLNEGQKSQERKTAQDGCRNCYSVTVARIG